MARVLIALGSNLGDRSKLFERAIESIDELPGTSVKRVSKPYSTKPIGGPGNQPEFLNGAAIVQTVLEPAALLAALQDIESGLGRQRRVRWDSRSIDLDVLLYDELTFDDRQMTIPHPRMAFRRFMLEPAVEIAGNWIHPTVGWTLAKLLEHLKSFPPRFALCGFAALGLRQLESQITSRVNCETVFDRIADPIWSLKDSEQRLQCASRWAQLLDNPSWQTPEVPVFTNFIVEEAGLQCSNDVTHEVKTIADSVPSPKLLIVPEPVVDPKSPSELFVDQLYRFVIDSRKAPVLRISIEKPETAFDEIAAAIEAMK